MSRDIELAIEYLEKERTKHLHQEHALARDSRRPEDYISIVLEAKLTAKLSTIITDLKLLDTNAAEFIHRFLNHE